MWPMAPGSLEGKRKGDDKNSIPFCSPLFKLQIKTRSSRLLQPQRLSGKPTARVLMELELMWGGEMVV